MTELPDAVVVGGGILGVCLAYELALRTLRVTLLESHALASGVSGSSFAWINATSKDEDAAYHRLNAAGMGAYDALAMQYGADAIGLHGGGSLHWIAAQSSPETQANLLQRTATLQEWNYPVVLLNGREMRALEPDVAWNEASDSVTGLFAPADRWLDVPRFVRFLAAQCHKMKVNIREYSPVVDFTTGITRAITGVRTAEGLLATPLVILAAGLDTPRLAAQIIGEEKAAQCVPMKADAGLLIETPAGIATGICRRVLYPPDPHSLHIRPASNGGLLIGADDGDCSVQDSDGLYISPDAVAALWNRATNALPALRDTVEISQLMPRICLRPMPADKRPIVGTLPDVRGVFVAVTHSGITLAPLLAQMLADEIIGKPVPPELLPYRPQRFFNTT